MGKLKRICIVFSIAFVLTLLLCWILTRKWYYFASYIYLIEYVNGTGGFAVDMTNFMIGMWGLLLVAFIMGVVIGYVYEKTPK